MSLFSPKRILKSFGFAFNGIFIFFKHEKNAQLHLIAAAIAIALGIYLPITKFEWYIVILCICGVIALEMINSAIERWIDFKHPEIAPEIKWIKDIAAGAVLVVSIGAVIIGGLIFIPHLLA